MNKGLKALDIIANYQVIIDYEYGVTSTIKEQLPNSCNIIKKELEDYDLLKRSLNRNWVEVINDEKKLKALELIKEKPIVALVDYKYTYEEWLELVDEKDKDLFKNKEEYDLLKEVLR